MIATLVIYGSGTTLPRLAEILAIGSVAGSALQFVVQLPAVWRVAPDARLTIGITLTAAATDLDIRPRVHEIIRNFVPVFFSRGVVQVSAYVDTLLASLLPTGAVAGLTNAQLLYTLPISLFGMSVSAAELPAMSAVASGDRAALESVRLRLDDGLRRIAYFVVPSAMGRRNRSACPSCAPAASTAVAQPCIR